MYDHKPEFITLPYVISYGPALELAPADYVHPVKAGDIGRLLINARDTGGLILTHYSVDNQTFDISQIDCCASADRDNFCPLMLFECPSPLTIDLQKESSSIPEISVMYSRRGRMRYLLVSSSLMGRILRAYSGNKYQEGSSSLRDIYSLIEEANDPKNIKAATDVLDAICLKNKTQFAGAIEALTKISHDLVEAAINQ